MRSNLLGLIVLGIAAGSLMLACGGEVTVASLAAKQLSLTASLTANPTGAVSVIGQIGDAPCGSVSSSMKATINGLALSLPISLNGHSTIGSADNYCSLMTEGSAPTTEDTTVFELSDDTGTIHVELPALLAQRGLSADAGSYAAGSTATLAWFPAADHLLQDGGTIIDSSGFPLLRPTDLAQIDGGAVGPVTPFDHSVQIAVDAQASGPASLVFQANPWTDVTTCSGLKGCLGIVFVPTESIDFTIAP